MSAAREQGGAPLGSPDRGCDDLDRRVVIVQVPEHAKAVRLRLDRDDAGSEPPPGAHTIADVGANIEAEIAGSDELLVEARYPTAPPQRSVVDKQRASKPECARQPASCLCHSCPSIYARRRRCRSDSLAGKARVHVDEVKRYYEQNTRRFLSLGQGGTEGAIHRAVWGEDVHDRRAAFHFVHELVRRQAKGLGSPLHVVDLGCGVGACLLYLAERITMEGIGVTVSPLQVELARRRAAAHSAGSSLEFREGDFEQLPPMEAMDLAVAIESFIHCAHPDRFMREAAAVLRPGGRLVLCDDFLATTALEAGPRDGALLREFKRGWHAGTLETVDAVDEIARRHGFALASDTDLSPYLELGRLRDRLVAPLVRLGKRAWGRSKYFQALLGGDALQRCLRRGLVQYRFVVWTATGSTSG